MPKFNEYSFIEMIEFSLNDNFDKFRKNLGEFLKELKLIEQFCFYEFP